jgi:type II secretory pathway pseudopilin PulG
MKKLKIKNLKFKILGGMTLLEVLVVITIFAALGILVTESVALTLQGAKKSASLVRTRENLDNSLGIIERQIRGASSIVSCSPDGYTINYLDQNGSSSSFSCQQMGSVNSYISSGSAQLTNSSVNVTGCSFKCFASSGATPPLVTIDLAMQDASASGIQSASASASTQIYLRNY